MQDASGNVYRKVDGGRLSRDSEQRIHDYTSHTDCGLKISITNESKSK